MTVVVGGRRSVDVVIVVVSGYVNAQVVDRRRLTCGGDGGVQEDRLSRVVDYLWIGDVDRRMQD